MKKISLMNITIKILIIYALAAIIGAYLGKFVVIHVLFVWIGTIFSLIIFRLIKLKREE